MQAQKDGIATVKRDKTVATKGFARKNVAELGREAMRGVHHSHARDPIASHLQHDYLPVIEGKYLPSNRAVCEKDYRNGRL